jgi:iron complex transport system substrate-binding protein
MTINHEQMIHDVIERCGGTNIFAKEKLLVPQVTREAVLAANPDLMIGTQQAGKDMDWSMWRSFENLSANRYQAFLSIPGPSISQPTPSILQGTRQICEAIARVRELKSQASKAGTR